MMFSKKVCIVTVILGVALLLVLKLFPNRNQETSVLNPYFFDDEKTSVNYEGYFLPLSTNEINHEVTLNINKLKEYDRGNLFTLELSQLNVEDPLDKISMGRRYLGYFFVTSETIYCLPSRGFDGYTSEQNDRVIKLIEENTEEFFNNSYIACSESGTEDVVDENGWHSYVVANEDKRTFYYYNDDISGTKFYEKIVWQRNKGIIYYKSGAGSMFMHVEFGFELEEEKTNIVRPLETSFP